MVTKSTVRTAQKVDLDAIEEFFAGAAAIHRHLDWRSYSDWIGNKSFLLSLNETEIKGLFVCTAEPNEVFWVRIFGAKHFSNLENEWQTLFQYFLNQISPQVDQTIIASIAYFDWMKDLLLKHKWQIHQEVVQLKWMETNLNKLDKKWPAELTIRPMAHADLKTVTGIDQDCFTFIWRQSYDVIHRAYEQSSYTTVAVLNNEIVGFQISTSHRSIAHLARLAVVPKFQGQHIGQALVQNMLRHFSRPWIHEITVNTQHDNIVSLNLYQKMNFEPTGEQYPIYLYHKG